MIPLIVVILSFVLTGLIGNSLIQKWQQRNWIQQRRLLRAENSIEELKKIIDEIMTLADARNYRTRRLLLNFRSGNAKTLTEIKQEYDRTLAAWNDKFNSFCVRLTIFAEYRYTEWLESDIQPRFVKISEELEQVLKLELPASTSNNPAKAALEDQLNSLSGRLFKFSRDLLNLLLKKQEYAYVGRKIYFAPCTLHLFSTWYLFKALFEPRHAPQTIISPLSDFDVPTFFRA
jgi:hypothetical protein